MATIKRWAEVLLSNPLYAALFAGVCMFIPFLAWLGWGWVALTALRYGERYSAWVVLGAAVGVYILTQLVGEIWQVAAFHMVLFIIPIWIFSLVLRASVSLNFTLQCAAIGLLVLMLIADYLQIMTPAMIVEFLQVRFNHVVTFDEATLQSMNDFAKQFAASWPSAFFWVYVTGLFLGRWWQAALDNPHGFQREFHALRLNFWVGSVAAIFLLISFWLPITTPLIAAVGLVVSLLLLAGLALIHYWVAFKKYSGWVLVAVYLGLGLLTIIFVPILIVIAVVDSITDLRSKIVAAKS